MVYSKEGRWDQTERPYTPADVKRLSGSVKVEHTLAKMGAENSGTNYITQTMLVH